MWSCDQILVGYSSIFMREVIISQIIYGFVQKADFERWSSFNVNTAVWQKDQNSVTKSVTKRLKLKVKKCWGKLEGGISALSPSVLLPPSNSVKNDLADSRPVKTIKKEKYRFHYLIACSVELTCIVTAIILEDTFRNIKTNWFYLWGNRVEEIALLSLHVCRCSTSASVRL